MKLVSVIVPVYNTEKYLSECINSLICQTYKNIEIILIDDGSIDNSPNICDNFSKKDNRIKVIHKLNSGVSSARNYGLEVCTGELIMFVDSDDYIDKDMIFNMVNQIKDNDVVMCGYSELFLKKNINHSPIISEKLDKINSLNRIFNDNNICGFLVNKIFKKSIIEKYNIKFKSNIFLCEDLLFNIEYLTKIDKIKVIEDVSYKYRMRKNSATWKNNSKKFQNIIICFDIIDKILLDNNISNVDYEYFKISLLLKLSSYDFKKNKSLVLEYYQLLNKSNLKRKLKLFIMKNANYIYKIYMKIKISRLGLFD